MNLAQAKETARKINGQEVPIAYRNVWGFFPPDEEDAPKLPIVLITKDGSNPPRQGVFLDDGKRDGFIDYETGEEVEMREVFGKAFFDDDPSLMEDPCANSSPVAERIDQLFREVDELLHTKGDNRIVKFVLFNSLDDDDIDDETTYLRLVVLTNYLRKLTQPLDLDEVIYLSQELYNLDASNKEMP